jgi:ArsR family transcriptional regulator, arsenate/arsenite/antimonite-responsive transcriptional repressor
MGRQESGSRSSISASGRFISRFIKITLDEAAEVSHVISMEHEIAAAQLEAIGNPTRLQLYRILVRAGAEGLPVGHVQEKLGIAASTLSHHVKKLVDTGLVTQERQATTLICRAHYPAMQSLIGFLADECCADGTCPPGTQQLSNLENPRKPS